MDREDLEMSDILIFSVAFALLALAGFLIFLPYASGLAAPVSWLDIGKSILKVWY